MATSFGQFSLSGFGTELHHLKGGGPIPGYLERMIFGNQV